MDKWRRSAFFDSDEDPLGPLANLVDIILVFVCGLVAALVSFSPDLQQHFATAQPPRDISLGKEMATVPESVRQQVERGSGYEALGKVYRDPKTGKLVLIGE